MAKAKRQITRAARRREAPTLPIPAPAPLAKHYILTPASLEVSPPQLGRPALIQHHHLLAAKDHDCLPEAVPLTTGRPRGLGQRFPTPAVEKAPSTAADPISVAINRRLANDERPGSTVTWDIFCQRIRDDCNAGGKRGYGDRTIKTKYAKLNNSPT
jgi:hypothetical protein